MKRVTEGLTPTEFLAIINEDFIELATIRSVEAYPTIEATDNFIDVFNSNYGSNIIVIGDGGTIFKNNIDASFIDEAGGLVDPVITWVEDYANIVFESNTDGIELYSSKNEEEYILVTTIDAGTLYYHDTTWQNASMRYKYKKDGGSVYSGVVTIATPIVFRTDQSTLNTVEFGYFWVKDTYTVNIDFGDGANQDITLDNNYATPNVSHDYDSEDQYWITISGDTDKITALFNTNANIGNLYGDLTKWILPTELTIWHLYEHDFSGTDITGWFPLPVNLTVFMVEHNQMIGEWDAVTIPAALRIMEIGFNGFTGDPISEGVPNTLQHLRMGGNEFDADFTGLTLESTILSDLNLGIENANDDNNLYGDLSGIIIPAMTDVITIRCADCGFTNFPLGSFRWVSVYNFKNNSCDADEIDLLLAAIDIYFTGEVVPLTDCAYTLNGTGMGIPSGTGLTSKTSIEGKYTAEEFTATILVNS